MNQKSSLRKVPQFVSAALTANSLAASVLVDIVRSNIAVAGIILGRKRGRRTPGFVEIPLDLRNPYGLATLGCIITSTPGTIWVDFDEASGDLPPLKWSSLKYDFRTEDKIDGKEEAYG